MYKLLVISKNREKKVRVDLNNNEQIIRISKNELEIDEDIILILRQCEDNRIRCQLENQDYCLIRNNKPQDYIDIENASNFTIHGSQKQDLVVCVSETTDKLAASPKYTLYAIDSIEIGSSEKMDIVVKSALVSKVHCKIFYDSKGWHLCDSSLNGVYVNGCRIEDTCDLNGGEIIDIFGIRIVFCNSFIAIQEAGCEYQVSAKLRKQVEAASVNRSKKQPFFHRSPRNIKVPILERIVIDVPPSKQVLEKKPLAMLIGPSFTMMIPMMLGSVLAVYSYKSSGASSGIMMYTGIITALTSVGIGILWAFITLHYDKKKYAQEEDLRKESYGKYLTAQMEKIEVYGNQLRCAWSDMYKKPEDCLLYDRTSKELWARNRHQEDCLMERIGTGTLNISEYIDIPRERFEIQEDELLKIPQKIKESCSFISDIPKGVDIGKQGIIGIIGDGNKGKAFDLARLLILQIAANNCYTDVKMAFAFDGEKDGSEWKRYGFLPHVWSADYQMRYMAATKEESEELFQTIISELRERTMSTYEDREKICTHYVLFVSDISLLDGQGIVKYITEDAEKYSLTVVTLSEKYDDLLNNCTYVLYSGNVFCGVHSLRTDYRESIVFDQVSVYDMELFTRKLADIRVNEDEAAGGIPESLTFFEMLHIHRLSELNVKNRWEINKSYNSLRAVIGQKAGGKDCILDVHEKYHGPHGLVAGTTGSGKSETLQTYILSLAINYSPDDVGFFIIDYKGGGMADLFEGLPHMIGAISNLSGSSIKRAMVSIKSENMRRQRVFHEAGVNNINHYTRLVKAGETELPIPHLFIIVDEFAELKREQPEFMKELISVAQVGRSLGVHLILATQKPAGTVDENIWSNSKFKLCLRVQDKQDSKEMLHKEDAAFITQAGRGYLQVGNDEVYELFQSGWSGAEYIADTNYREDTNFAVLSDLGTIISKKRRIQPEKSSVKVISQLEAVCGYLKEVAASNGYNRDYRLWIPPISNPLYIEDIPDEKEGMSDGFSLQALVGMYDDPGHQKQCPYMVDLSEMGNIAVCGTNLSGKSTFLQTMISSLFMRYSPDKLNIYIADFSNKSLGCFEHAPQIGGIVTEEDQDRIRKLIYLMNKTIALRKRILAGVNYNSYIRSGKDGLPAIIFVIDNYSGFREYTSDSYVDDIVKILHDGPAYGIYSVITGNSYGSNDIPGRVEDNIATGIALLMNDKYQYPAILRTGRIDIEPENLKGRGLVKIGDAVLEFQTALAVKAEDEMERLSRLRAISESIAGQWQGEAAEPIPEIPEKPEWNLFASRKDVVSMIRTNYLLPLGYDENSADAYGIDLRNTFCYLISGRVRTGKKNTMKILMNAAHMRDADLVVIEHGTSDFAVPASDIGAVYLNSQSSQAEYFKHLVPDFVERNQYKNALKEKGYEQDEIFERMCRFKETYIFIADINQFIESLYEPEEGVTRIAPFIENIADKGSCHNIYLIAINDVKEASVLRGYAAYDYMTNYHTGIQLGGNASETTFFDFSNLSFTEQNQSHKAGIGMIPVDNDESGVKKVVIPQYRRNMVNGES